MSEFDYGLFRKLFDRLYLFDEFVSGDESRKGAKVEDNVDGSDITACLDLSIFPLLKNIEMWGENVDLTDYVEIKDGERTTGARGVICSCMDWCDQDEPIFYYEFAHIEKKDGAPEEYVKELHIDDVVMNVLAPLDKKLSTQEKGSEEGRSIMVGLVKRAWDDVDGLTSEEKEKMRYRCLIEGENFEIWKIGFNQGPYQLFMTAPSFVSGLNLDTIINHYLNGVQFKDKVGPFKPMSEEELSQTRLLGYDGNWYNVGVVDLDLSLTARLQEEAKEKTKQELANIIYNAVLSHNFELIDMKTLPNVLSVYTPLQIALMSVASMDTEEHTEQFGKTFLQQCQQYCPDKLKSANTIISQVRGIGG